MIHTFIILCITDHGQAKLEETLDDLEDSLERERRKRTDEEKTRRKIEADVKLTQVRRLSGSREDSEFLCIYTYTDDGLF